MLLVLACTGPAEPLGSPPELSLVEETLLDGVVLGAAPLPDHDVVLSTGSQIGVLSPDGSLSWHGGEGELLDAARLGPDLVVATGAGLLAGAELLTESPLPLTDVTRIEAYDGSLYLASDGLYRFRGTQLSALTLDGDPLGPDFALGPQGGIWTLQDERAVLFGGELPAQDALLVGPCQVLAGSEWARFDADEGWLRYELGRQPEWLDGPEEATWAGDDQELLLLTDWGRVDRPEGRIAVDSLGRLLVSDVDGLRRLSVGYPVALVGLLPGSTLEADTLVTVAPTLAEQVEWLEADIDGVSVDIDQGELTVRVADWADGAWHTLTVRAGYPDAEGSGSVRFRATIVGDVTWTEHIEPIYADNCQVCHGGSTETELDSPDAWEARYDDIWAAVSEGRMPLGKDPLSPAQLALIAGWADGGFL